MISNLVENIDNTWSLFLDRDGVINRRIVGGYVTNFSEFIFLKGVPESISFFSSFFHRIFIVTNQQGIGKGLMTEEDLQLVHQRMLEELEDAGGKVDRIYYCPLLNNIPGNYRKPSPDMARMAAHDFPDIDLSKSVMVGDSSTDIEFGVNAGMKTVFIGHENICSLKPNLVADDLSALASLIKSYHS